MSPGAPCHVAYGHVGWARMSQGACGPKGGWHFARAKSERLVICHIPEAADRDKHMREQCRSGSEDAVAQGM